MKTAMETLAAAEKEQQDQKLVAEQQESSEQDQEDSHLYNHPISSMGGGQHLVIPLSSPVVDLGSAAVPGSGHVAESGPGSVVCDLRSLNSLYWNNLVPPHVKRRLKAYKHRNGGIGTINKSISATSTVFAVTSTETSYK